MFRTMQRRLHQLALHDPGELGLKEQDFGYKYNPHSWLQDPGLDVQAIKVFAFDWMHCWVEGGVWDVELCALMGKLAPHGYGGRHLHAYLQRFQWPKGYASGRWVCKGSVQERAQPREVPPNGSASEMVSVAPVVAKWLTDVVMEAGICTAHVTSALLCISVMDLLTSASTGSVTPEMLADAIARHYAAHLAAYGYSVWKPKHHFMMHIPSQLQQFKFLVACFVHERKHKTVKRWAVQHLSKRAYERSLLEECTLAHLTELQEPLLKPFLQDPRIADARLVSALREGGFPAADSVLSARSVRVHSRLVVKGDVVLYCGGGLRANVQAGEVYFHASIGGECITCLSNWPVNGETEHWKKVVVADQPCTVPSAWLLQSVIFSPASVGKKATVLMPCVFS